MVVEKNDEDKLDEKEKTYWLVGSRRREERHYACNDKMKGKWNSLGVFLDTTDNHRAIPYPSDIHNS